MSESTIKQENKSIIKHSASISAVVLFGKILGFVKQAIIAWAFGSNSITDVYFAADGYTAMFGEIMRTSVAPTVLTQYVKLEEEKRVIEAKKLIKESFVFFGSLGLILVIVNIFFAPYICNIIGISYSIEQKKELIFFLRILCPVMLFTAISGVAQGFLDAHKKFLQAKLCSFFFSLSIIISVILFKDYLGIRALLYGFILGYALHTIYMVTAVGHQSGILLGNPFKDPNFGVMMKKFTPLVVGNSIVDLGHLVDKIVASSLAVGSVSALYYGQVISNDIVNAVIITSIGTVLLTVLTKNVAARESQAAIKNRVQNLLCSMTLMAGLLSILYLVEGRDLICIFFERGSFNSYNTLLVSSVASFYSIGFVFMANREILTKVHYAYQDTITPMINSIIGVCLNLMGSVILSRFMGVSGVALATSISMMVVFTISVFTVKKHLAGFPINSNGVKDICKIILSLFISYIIGKCVSLRLISANLLVRMVAVGLLMCAVYILALIFLKESIICDSIKGFKRFV